MFKKDNGNCIFDDTISIPELSEVCYDFDVPDAIYTVKTSEDRFLDNVLTYIAGFIMRTLVDKEKCTYCYAYLTESKQRVSCQLINIKQLGGLVYPTFDIVTIVHIANRNMKFIVWTTQLN